MHKLPLLLLLTLLTYTANCQKKAIAVFNPPLQALPSYIDPVTKDTITPVVLVQSHVDSFKNVVALTGQHSTQIVAANLSITSFGGSLLITKQQVTKDSALIQGVAKQVGNSQIDIANNVARTDSIVKNWPSGGGGVTTAYKFRNISSNVYTISVADSGQVLFFTGQISTTVTVPQMMKPISVKLVSQSKQIIVVPASGMNLNSVSGLGVYYRRIQSGGAADVVYNSNTSANLVGQITK